MLSGRVPSVRPYLEGLDNISQTSLGDLPDPEGHLYPFEKYATYETTRPPVLDGKGNLVLRSEYLDSIPENTLVAFPQPPLLLILILQGITLIFQSPAVLAFCTYNGSKSSTRICPLRRTTAFPSPSEPGPFKRRVSALVASGSQTRDEDVIFSLNNEMCDRQANRDLIIAGKRNQDLATPFGVGDLVYDVSTSGSDRFRRK